MCVCILPSCLHVGFGPYATNDRYVRGALVAHYLSSLASTHKQALITRVYSSQPELKRLHTTYWTASECYVTHLRKELSLTMSLGMCCASRVYDLHNSEVMWNTTIREPKNPCHDLRCFKTQEPMTCRFLRRSAAIRIDCSIVGRATLHKSLSHLGNCERTPLKPAIAVCGSAIPYPEWHA